MSIRTTIVLNEELARDLRARAGERGVGLSRLIGDLLKAALEQETSDNAEPFVLEWPTVRGRALPGVDIADRDRLYDLMEDRG